MDNKDPGVGKKPVLSNLKSNFICYHCQKLGRKASMCPLRKQKSVELCFVPHSERDDDVKDNEMIPHKHVVDVMVNCNVAKVLADTGS